VETTGGEAIDASVFIRAALSKGEHLSGPAVIVEDGTSTMVPSGYHARIGAGGDIVIEDTNA
jgi:N-methylhydantoinase A